MKVFISQPMNGMTDDEIKRERERIVNRVTEMFGTVEVIDSYFEDVPEGVTPLWYLGQSIVLLSEADVAYFARGWEDMRGCRIEHQCAVDYGVKTIVEDDDGER